MSIRQKIILFPVAVALLVAFLMGTGMFLSGQRAMTLIHDRDLDTAQAWLESSITRTHEVALAQAEIIAALPVVQEAVAAGDDMALERLFGPGFEHMKAEAGVAQLQFHLPPATSLIRIHNLEKRGDDLSAFRRTVVDANTSGASLSGLERGRAGIGARGVAVIRHAGRPVGTVEVGLDVGVPFLDGLSQRSGNDFEFYLMPDTGIDTFDAADRTDYRLGATFEGPALLSAEDLARLQRDPFLDRDVAIAGAPFAMRALAVRDYSGAVAGIITIAMPSSGYTALAGELMTSAIAAALIAMLIGTGIGFWSGHNLAGRFACVVLTVERLARGDGDLVITGTDRNDEIGGIFRALKMFQTTMQENLEMASALETEEAAHKAEAERTRAREADLAEERRAAEEADRRRRQELAETEARAAQAEQAAAEARVREQQEVVQLLAEGLEALAKGDLRYTIATALPGDYETLRHNFNRALARLSQTLSDLDRTAGGIDGEVVAVAEAADELSRRTERNAATLEQTAAALDELTSSVRSAAAGATEARRLIESANRNADDGGVSVAHAVEAMNRIEEASRGIAKITGVIDEIAFQTNLLALNAGVEAARAGEAGRGFAVVASEVRALAQRSSEAAREISDMIAASETEIRQGVDLVGKTGVALDRILDSVRDISAQVMVIATSSEEQAIGLGEINNAVNQLDTATQQNAAMFEETSAATTVLNAKTRDLVAAIRRFEFDGTAAPAARAAQTASEVAGRAVA